MPTYEYRCKSCGHKFERFQGITEKPVRLCPECGRAVERLIGAGAGIIFKGSGFYQTDYRSDSYKQKARSESAAGGSGSGSRPAEPGAAPGEAGSAPKEGGSAKGAPAGKKEKKLDRRGDREGPGRRQ